MKLWNKSPLCNFNHANWCKATESLNYPSKYRYSCKKRNLWFHHRVKQITCFFPPQNYIISFVCGGGEAILFTFVACQFLWNHHCLWTHPTPENHKLNKLKSTLHVPEEASTQVSVFLAKWFLRRNFFKNYQQIFNDL